MKRLRRVAGILVVGGIVLAMGSTMAKSGDSFLEGSVNKQYGSPTGKAGGKPYAVKNPTVKKADTLTEQYKLGVAEAKYRQVLQKNSNDAGAHNGLGKILYYKTTSSNQIIREDRDRYYQEATRHFMDALRLQPNFVDARLNLGTIYMEQERYSDAQEEFERALALSPKSSEAMEKLGASLYKQGKVAEAMPYLQKAVAINPKNTSAQYYLGAAQNASGNQGHAIDSLNKSLYQYPNSAPVHHELGVAYEEQGNGAAAVAEFKKALVIKPELADAALRLSHHYEDRGDYGLALEQLKNTLEAQTDTTQFHYDLHMRIAELSMKNHQPEVAYAYYCKLAQHYPHDPLIQDGLSKSKQVLARQQKIEANALEGDLKSEAAAMTYAEQALAYNPNNLDAKLLQIKLNGGAPTLDQINPNVAQAVFSKAPLSSADHVKRGELRLARFEMDQAAKELEQAMRSAKTWQDKITLGEILLKLGVPGMAETLFEQVHKQYPTDQAAWIGLERAKKNREEAKLLVTQAKKTNAREIVKRQTLESALKLDQWNADAHKELGNYFAKQKSNTEAIRHYHAYLTLNPAMEEAARIRAKLGKMAKQ